MQQKLPNSSCYLDDKDFKGIIHLVHERTETSNVITHKQDRQQQKTN